MDKEFESLVKKVLQSKLSAAIIYEALKNARGNSPFSAKLALQSALADSEQ